MPRKKAQDGKRAAPRRKAAPDPLVDDFGPEPRPETPAPPPSGPLPGVACAGEACLLKPLGDLVGRFGLEFARGHVLSLSRAAFSGLELMKALRDFLDEEIAMAERATQAREGPRVTKIPVE